EDLPGDREAASGRGAAREGSAAGVARATRPFGAARAGTAAHRRRHRGAATPAREPGAAAAPAPPGLTCTNYKRGCNSCKRRRSRPAGDPDAAPIPQEPALEPAMRATDLRFIEALLAPTFETASFTHVRRRWLGRSRDRGSSLPAPARKYVPAGLRARHPCLARRREGLPRPRLRLLGFGARA